MNATATTRTWDAVITFAFPDGTKATAPYSAPHDLMRSTCRGACLLAASAMRGEPCQPASLQAYVARAAREHGGLPTHANVQVYKTTKARGRELDRDGGYVWREQNTVYIDNAR